MKINIRVKMVKRINILLMDDNAILRRDIIEIIKRMGFKGKVYEAGCFESSKKFSDENEIDFFIIDWNTADDIALNYVKLLRASKKYENVPIMVMANEADMGKMVEALAEGASNYIVKPIQVNEFIDRFQSAYEKHEKTFFLQKGKKTDE